MDTQGVFDTNTSQHKSTCLFSLSVMLSSVQIFNIKQDITADALRHLELYTEFGHLLSQSSESGSQNGHKAFQELIFLVRDWPNPQENHYGWEGGRLKLEGQGSISPLRIGATRQCKIGLAWVLRRNSH